MTEFRFWQRMAWLGVIVNVAVWVGIAVALVLLASGCRVMPWEKPVTSACRLYVPNAQDDPRQQTFYAFRRWAHYLDPRSNGTDHILWYGAPYYPHEQIVGMSKRVGTSIWNRWPCP